MVKKYEEMRGIHLNPRTGQVFLNESYQKFLKTMYGRKFPPHFVAMLNDLLDSGLVETLDDMKKIILYFEWKMESKDHRIDRLIGYMANMEESLQRVIMYTEGLEERFAKTRAKLEKMEGRKGATRVEAKVAMAAAPTSRPPTTRTRSASEILAQLRGEEVPTAEVAGRDIGADAEIGAADETEFDVVGDLERPAELTIVKGRDIEGSLGMGARLVEAEIGADDLETTPEIMAIQNKIEKVKGMKALHSDDEIVNIFKGKKNGKGKSIGKGKGKAKKRKKD